MCVTLSGASGVSQPHTALPMPPLNALSDDPAVCTVIGAVVEVEGQGVALVCGAGDRPALKSIRQFVVPCRGLSISTPICAACGRRVP